MNKAAHTYHTPATALAGRPEQAGALYYGRVRALNGVDWHEVAIIREERDEVLCAGPTLFGWRRRDEVERDDD